MTKVEIAANCMGLDVPMSPFLHSKRIARINESGYEGQELRAGLHLVEENDVILELGAGLGVVSGTISKNRKPSKVISYEANPSLVPHIRKLHEINGLSHVNSVRNRVLLSAPDAPKTMPFFIHKSFLGSTLVADAIAAKDTVEIEVDNFNEVSDELKPDILLMDIEGGELELLRNADLSSFRAIVIEFHPKIYGIPAMRECKNLLRAAGFKPLDEFSTRRVWAATKSGD